MPLVSNGNRILTGLLIVFVALEFSVIMVYYASIREQKFFLQSMTFKVMTIAKTTSAFVASTDLVLASSLVFLLRRRRSGFKTTDSIVQRLIAYTISTSLVTFLVASLGLMALIAFPMTFLWIGLAHLISQCKCWLVSQGVGGLLIPLLPGYVNCMFVSYVCLVFESTTISYLCWSLNARQSLREELSRPAAQGVSIHLSEIRVVDSNTSIGAFSK